jgi:hypothetical protein
MEITEVDHKTVEIHGKSWLIGTCSKDVEKMLSLFICECWNVLQEHWNKLFIVVVKQQKTIEQAEKKSSVLSHLTSEMKFD